jgi:hypothetical protein
MPVPSRLGSLREFVVPFLTVLFASFIIIVLGDIPACAQTVLTPALSANTVPPVPNPCPRLQAGAVVTNPPALYSRMAY